MLWSLISSVVAIWLNARCDGSAHVRGVISLTPLTGIDQVVISGWAVIRPAEQEPAWGPSCSLRKLAFRRDRSGAWNQSCMAAWLLASHPVMDARAGLHQRHRTDSRRTGAH